VNRRASGQGLGALHKVRCHLDGCLVVGGCAA
jgi:hypothetical protein